MFIVCTILFIVTIILLFLDSIKPCNYPPGPTWYPVLGNGIQICYLRRKYGMFCKVIANLDETFGKKGTIGIKIGKDKIVFANSYEAINEMMTNKDMDGRPTGLFYETRTWGSRKGIIFTDESFWMEQRKFVVRHLKEFGFARRGMIDLVQNEARQLMIDVDKIIESQGGNSGLIEMNDLFGVNVLNTLWCMLAGIRYDRNDKELKNLQELFHELLKNIDMIGCLFSHFPFLRYIAPSLSGYRDFIDTHDKIYQFIGKEIKNHVNTLDCENPRDLMDIYLNISNTRDCKAGYRDKQLLAICLDMFLAGSETTNKTLGFAFLHITNNTCIQERMQKELDEVIGRHRLPRWDDRENLPYCYAVVHEALRFFAGNSFGIPHRALRATKLCGFDIPKDTMVVGCFSGMLMDSKIFPNPENFDPERFLKDNKLTIPSCFIPFGVGKRRCMGEMLGRQNLFLFVTTLLQNFKFSVPGGCRITDDQPIDGATPSVKPFTALVTRRQKYE